MQLFIKRFWGFDPVTVPLVMFSSATYRDKLIRQSRAGDRMVFVATKGEPTLPEEQGRLLGMAEFGRRAVDTLDVVGPEALAPEDWEGNRLRLPKSIPIVRAWLFSEPRPMLLDVLARQLPMSAISGAVLLENSEAAKVLALPHSPINLPQSEAIKRERGIVDRIA
jgi:hypothetical protein